MGKFCILCSRHLGFWCGEFQEMEDGNFEYLWMEFVVRFNFAFSLLNGMVGVVSDDNLMWWIFDLCLQVDPAGDSLENWIYYHWSRWIGRIEVRVEEFLCNWGLTLVHNQFLGFWSMIAHPNIVLSIWSSFLWWAFVLLPYVSSSNILIWWYVM